jgi:multidrug efflux pump subunit AcrB
MTFATWSLRNPIPAVLFFVLLALAGLYGFQRLSIQDLPDLDLPTISVTLAQPGAAPTQLETEVARRVEDSLATVTGLKHIRTSVTAGQVQMLVEFELKKPLSDALLDTKDAIDRIRSDLPADMQQPAIGAVTLSGKPILTYAIASERMDEASLSWFVDDVVGKALLAIPGVGKVARVGGVQREVRVEVDPVRMASLGVTAADISRALKNMQHESSGGLGHLGQAEQSVRTMATVRQASELEALPLALPGGRELRLDQVATVHDGAAQRTQAARLDGHAVVGFAIYRAKGFDETRVDTEVTKALESLRARHATLSVVPVSSSVDYTREQFRGSMQMLWEGAILSVLVVWLFLRDWRATLVAASALPLSILPAFAAMAWLGYSLNTLTLLALAVVVGILVDDAIVEVENIERHRRMGKSILQATGDAVDEIALAVIATTLTLVAVFVPTTLMSGVPGLLFRQFGWTAAIAVLASLVVARLLTPILAVWLLRPHARVENGDGAVMRLYMRAARWALVHRRSTLAAAVLFFASSVALVPLIPTGLFPPADEGAISVAVQLPPGSSFDDTLALTEAARGALSEIDGVRSVFATVGAAQAPDDDGIEAAAVRKGAMTLILAPRDLRRPQSDIEADVRRQLADIPGARFSVGDGPGETLSLNLVSDNAQALKASAQAFERELRGMGMVSNVNSTASLEQPEIVIRPNLHRAAELGVTTAAIGEVLRIATSGDFDAQLPKLNLDNRQIGIRVRVGDAVLQDLHALGNLKVSGRNGLVPLASVAELSVESGPAQIDRHDRRRYVNVSADLGATPLGDAQIAARALPSARGLPSDVALIDDGDTEIAGELASGFVFALVAAMLCVFCVLVLLFKDFLQPITILSAIPLSLGGALAALLLTRSELNVPSMIGLVMLMGIVTKNSILLVEYAVVAMQERGLALFDALIDACHKRARPIVMTTVAMIAGMLPIALGFGADASFRQPMAIAVIGGLLTSTLLSLLVVPVVFSYVTGAGRWLRCAFGGAAPPHSPEPFAGGAT